MSNVGIKSAKSGEDVKTTAEKNLSYTSGSNTFKIYRVLYFTSAGTKAHGLDYPPTFDFMLGYSGGYQTGSAGYFTGYGVVVSVDDTNVYCSVDDGYVILYIDPLNE